MKRIVFCVLIVLFAGLISCGSEGPKAVYIDSNKVFAEFDFTKELDSKFKDVAQKRKNITDSLEMNLTMLVNQLELNPSDEALLTEYELKRREFMLKKERFEEDNQQQLQSFNSQIMTQLNGFLEDFRKQNGYDILFGTGQNGVIMAADPSYDVSEKAIEFVNAKYQGE